MLARPDDIPTPRLVLRLMDREVVDACLVGNLQRAEHLLGIGIPTELVDEPTALKYAQAQLDADPLYRPWSVRAIILPAARTVVGHIRFHSRPDPDYLRPFAREAVEFGYHVFSDYRRHGYGRPHRRIGENTYYNSTAWDEKFFPKSILTLGILASSIFRRRRQRARRSAFTNRHRHSDTMEHGPRC
jgi:hypothetical protein